MTSDNPAVEEAIGFAGPQNTARPSIEQPDRGWPRVHLIYFVLASIDVMAIVASLFIGFHILATFERGADRNLAFDRQSAALSSFSSSVVDVQSAVATALMQQNADVASGDLRIKVLDFHHALAQFEEQLESTLDGAAFNRTVAILKKIDPVFSSMERTGQATLAAIAAGDFKTANTEFSRMQARYVTLQFLVRDIPQQVNLRRKASNEFDLAKVREMQSYEYVVAATLAVIILCIILYGHFVGRLMKRKYEEVRRTNSQLAESHAEIEAHAKRLDAVNNDVATLNRELKQNFAMLQESQDELLRKSKMAQMGQLTATVAHELRNPLGAVRTSAFLLERKVKGKALGIEPQLERINNGVMRCDDIISQLLDFARTKSLEIQTLNIDDWLARLVEEQALQLPECVELECHLGLEGKNVPFDPMRMSRVVINLLANASEAMVGKGDKKALSGSVPLITIATRTSARGIELSVSDNGPGISKEALGKIFEPLFTTKSFGTGLGLPAVEKIMEQHGGGLEVRSSPGEGAVFIAWWPAQVKTFAVA